MFIAEFHFIYEFFVFGAQAECIMKGHILSIHFIWNVFRFGAYLIKYKKENFLTLHSVPEVPLAFCPQQFNIKNSNLYCTVVKITGVHKWRNRPHSTVSEIRLIAVKFNVLYNGTIHAASHQWRNRINTASSIMHFFEQRSLHDIKIKDIELMEEVRLRTKHKILHIFITTVFSSLTSALLSINKCKSLSGCYVKCFRVMWILDVVTHIY